MTCLAACIGLAPAALSNGIGSQVQKPLALVVVGGTLLAPVLILLVLPVLIDMFSTRMSGNRLAPGRGTADRGERRDAPLSARAAARRLRRRAALRPARRRRRPRRI